MEHSVMSETVSDAVMIYPAEMLDEHFDPVALDVYWRFVAERQRVYARRCDGGMPYPWTLDPILNNEFITNMYRELDPGTQYVISDIIGNADYEDIDRIFNVMMYRLMGSQEPTHSLIACKVADYEPEVMITTLRERVASEAMKVFGDAYRVAGYHDEKGEDKIENVARLFVKLAAFMPELYRRIQGAIDVKGVFEALKGVPGFGEFLAHQCTVDLLYTSNGHKVLPYDENEFAVAGPGAKRGIQSLLRPHVRPRNLFIVMKWLHDHQDQAWDRLAQEYDTTPELIFPALADSSDIDALRPVPLSVCNIQSTLCEFFKYWRLWTGETKSNVRKYDPSAASDFDSPPVALTADALASLEALEPCLTPPPGVHPLLAIPDVAEALSEAEDLVIKDADGKPAVDYREPDMVDAYSKGRFDENMSLATTYTPQLSVPLPGGGSVTINITINVHPA